jgi:imidazolonepropionase
MNPIEADLLIRNASELFRATGCAGGPHDPTSEGSQGGSLACHEGKIVWIGDDSDLDRPGTVSLVPGGRQVRADGCTVSPGLVDCHTHAVFAGDRSAEFAQRCRGATYLDLARAGGGIQSTVRATRAASEEELFELALPRLHRLLSYGITTAEIKSGYGLTLADELKALRVVRRLASAQPVELVPTLLCAHAVPPEHAADRERYVALCLNEILPAVAEESLARFCDAFVEQGAFTIDEGRRILSRGRELGLIPRLHADQLSSMGAAELAGEVGAATADHLEAITPQGIAALAAEGVVAVLLPTSTLFLRQARFAPGRALLDAGLRVALATNLNPGSAMSENAPLALSLACLFNGLTPAEALSAFTSGGAAALGLTETHGALAVGQQADIVIHACPTHQHLPYHLAVNHVRTVLKRGQVVHEAPIPCCRAAT